MCLSISSNDNRFYAGVEAAYGQAAVITAQNRIPAVKLTARQQTEKVSRKDKTGTRTFPGDPAGLRRKTTFALQTYMTNWGDQTKPPSHDALFQACFGSPAKIWAGGTIQAALSAIKLQFTTPHGLTRGQAITLNGEMRFVKTSPDPSTIVINAPFSVRPTAGQPLGATATYSPATDLPSVSIADYWSPTAAVQRMLVGSAVNEMKVQVNGDFHEFEFSGLAADVIDSSSFEAGQAGLQGFPAEPISPFNYSLIPGHLGQAWLGTTETQFFTVTKAALGFSNDLTLRDNEFGSPLARCISPGIRQVSLEMSLYENVDSSTQSLYQAARQRSGIGVMLQLGQQPGQLFGIHMDNVIPEVPEFDDSDRKLQWHFVNCRAQGVTDDEIFVAFG